MQERRVKKIKGSHYVATHGHLTPDAAAYVHSNRGYSTDGEESHRAPSERTSSEYIIAHERTLPAISTSNERRSRSSNPSYPSNGYRHQQRHRLHGPVIMENLGRTPPSLNGVPTSTRAASTISGDAGSDIYVTSAAYKVPSEISRYSHHMNSKAPRSVYSVASTAKTNHSTRSKARHGAKVETMSAPNPFCPNVKGVCCLMLLLNLGLILVTLGFVIVVQFSEPFYFQILGIIFLIFGFLTLIGCMVYCVFVCRDAKTPSQVRNEDLYWTHHWQKNIGYTPQEINYKADKYDAYSDRYSVSKISSKYSDRGSNRY